MASSPTPTSPSERPQRPMSAMIRPHRSNSRISTSSKQGGSRASDEDAKTSVKVAVRIRPPLKPNDPGFDLIPQRFQRSMVHVTSPTSLSVEYPQGRKLFVFDRVFGEDVYQDGVWDYISESVNAFVQGYNVSVLAYGQSGSGKSYTMGTSGPAEQSDPKLMGMWPSTGVIPRAANVLFEKLAGPPTLSRHGSGIRTPTRYSTNSVQTLQSLAKAANDKSWQLKATYVEIYNEQLRDLLVPENTPANERNIVSIREDVKGRILLTGLHQVAINSIDDLLNALNFGSTIRQTDSTAINAKSSRSHAVFSINLVQRRSKSHQMSTQEKRMSVPLEAMNGTDSWVTVDSKLHFVDLAGSERLKNTGASGERAKEGISINAGLASLGKVISQLSSRQAGSHVSYRDSKLTRLLQDSLGGNAITYMIACITPAEFHLSETLNTVQYAQRARAIQSRPQIQQVSDESDKQALIDRLRAEISFLREQMRSIERGDRFGAAPQQWSERQNEKEIELQNQLLDTQENYSALSQRHAKLISEMTKARNYDSTDTPAPTGASGDSAVERLKRSNSFADAVEQVVLEYEKTIQSLESSLSNTRSSLSTTESSLLERETKCAYVDNVNQQLQARIQKLIERESSTEQYLHDLEAKLDGRNDGDERNSMVLVDLRKEIGRLRENEVTCEEYISTLEERLAEADQDSELMHREISRLEHVVERQRSLGKLDNLLHELDHIQTNGKMSEEAPMTNGIHKERPAISRHRQSSMTTLKEAIETPIPESDEEIGEHPPIASPDSRRQQELKVNDYTQSTAQSKFVAEKLESVNQELFDLRVEHESTVNEFDLLSAKYEEALRTLAALQDAVDESRRTPSRPTSFLADARVNELKNAGQSSSSRSLSSELSSAGVLPAASAASNIISGTNGESAGAVAAPRTVEEVNLVQEIDYLKNLHIEKDDEMNYLRDKYMSLQEQHEEEVGLLRTEIQKAKLIVPASPTSPVIRRKSSQNIMSVDRAHRYIASLTNIAQENFDDKPDTKQSFDINLQAVMMELHQRSERIQVLETELLNAKKEMETKMTIIAGLTRERSSLKGSSPKDMSMFSTMRDQLLQSENQIRILHESSASREKELTKEIESLKESLAVYHQNKEMSMPGLFPETPAAEINGNRELEVAQSGPPEIQSHDVGHLHRELSHWQARHKEVLDSLQIAENKLNTTVSELEASLAATETMRKNHFQELESQSRSVSQATASLEKERDLHATTQKTLALEIDDYKSTIKSHAEKIQDLEQSHIEAQRQIEEDHQIRSATQQHLDSHRTQIALLEQQLVEHQSAVEFHKHGLKSLHDSHADELKEAVSSTSKQAEADANARIAALKSQHDEKMSALKASIKSPEERVQDHEEAVNDHQRDLESRSTPYDQLDKGPEYSHIPPATSEHNSTGAQSDVESAVRDKAAIEASLRDTQAKVEELTTVRDQLTKELENVREKEQRASRLVEELEGQLSSTFEDSRATTSRLSLMQNSHDHEVLEARAATAKAQEEIEVLTKRLEQLESHRRSISNYNDGQQFNERSNSMTSNLPKSASVASLPSPPPAIPLPPLPTVMTNAPPANAPGSPPESNHASRELVSAQQVEEQEARIRTIEKHLFAEKQLTATLEEALVDLETQGNKVKADVEAWKKKAWAYEDELTALRKERNSNRYSLQAVEEERVARKEAEAARAQLEARMAAISKKKKSSFNCF